MKTLLITDLHDESPIRAITKEAGNFDRIVFLGDYGHPRVLRECLDVACRKDILIGNHDYEHARGIKIVPYDRKPDTWERYPDEQSYVLGKIQRKEFSLEETVAGRKVLFIHGTLVDNDFGPGSMWGWLSDKEEINENFRLMKEKDIWIMFRGHDHNGKVLVQDETEITTAYRYVQLSHSKRYIITIDNYGSDNPNRQPLVGRYGLFDETELTFETRSIF